MPPPRRRPVPSTPTVRPRVAGLRKRPEPAPADRAAPDVEQGEQVEPVHPEPTATTQIGTAQTATEPTATRPNDSELVEDEQVEPVRSAQVPGLIEPADDIEDVQDDTPGPTPRPRPTGRRRRTGEAVAPSVLAEPEPRPKHADDAASTATDSSGLLLAIGLVVLAALLVGLGAWFEGQAGNVRYNKALVDSAGTTEVAGQTREAVEKAFSYNFADVAATEKAANELLVGKAQCQYNAIFDPVRKLAPEQKLVVTVKAVSSGVTSLDGDRATVLLFLDQVTTRTTDNQSGGGIAMMRVGAVKADGRWKVDNMEMFGQTGPQAAETGKC